MDLNNPKSRTINMTGKIFGKLLVKDINKIDSGGNAHWNCLCECGGLICATGVKLRKGKVLFCKDCAPMDIKINDLTNKTFTQFRVLSLDKNNKKDGAYWFCVCDCGVFRSVLGSNLTHGKTTSCGHTSSALTHGMTNTRIYNAWASMKSRCLNSDHPNYHDYGGRGITINPLWYNFENFYEDMHVTYSDLLELDRINNDAGYSKENCRWTTRSINSFNTRKRKDNKTGRTGVHPLSNGKYTAGIGYQGKQIKLGVFLTFEEACIARESAEVKYFGSVNK